MLWDKIVAKTIRDYQNYQDKTVRERYGVLGGVVGIIFNFIVVLIEISVGFFVNSIAIIADGFHNIVDVFSSIISIVGVKLSNKPADREHPFGHGRIEYIAALIVAFATMIIGYQFLMTSFSRILHPSAIKFDLVSLFIVLASIPVKLLLSSFYRYLGKTINSTVLKAASIDAISDVFTLSAAIASLVLSLFTKAPVDGYIGLFVALLIMYAGFTMAKETLDPLLGTKPDPELVRQLRDGILHYDYITGSHDLMIHNYGPGRTIASIHAEVPCDVSVLKLHESIDLAEKEMSEKLDIILIIHMDPLNNDDEKVRAAYSETIDLLRNYSEVKSIHDFRIVGDSEKKNLVFDIVVDSKKVVSKKDEQALKEKIDATIKQNHPLYNAIVSIDQDYTEN